MMLSETSRLKLLASEFTQQINENEAISQYYFLEQGLSTSTSHSPGLMYVRKLMKDDALFGYALIFERI